MYASLPIVVVFPTPLTPTTSITYGIPGWGSLIGLVELTDKSSFTTSCSTSRSSSSDEARAPAFTLDCTPSIMRNVVSTPTSAETKTSSRLSKKSSSIFLRSPKTFEILVNKLVRVLLNPLSSDSFRVLPNQPSIYLFLALFHLLPSNPTHPSTLPREYTETTLKIVNHT